eukprot:7874305-Ditylum_brightwellii.AAC.1
MFMSSARAHVEGAYFDGDRGQSHHVLQHPTHSTFFILFISGLERQIGRDVWPNLGLAYWVLHIILRNLKEDLLPASLDRPHK